MALHQQLKSLVDRLGPQVLDDPDTLRAALDDYLDEGGANRGEINLLVDTVRLGGYRRMRELLQGGAAPGAAVSSAGEALARDRGSADVTGARWAVATLGYAAGVVPEGEVQVWDPSTRVVPPSGPGGPGGAEGSGQPYGGQPYPPPGQQPGQQPWQPAQQPAAYGGQPYGAPGQQPGAGAPQFGYGAPTTSSKRSKAPLIIVAVVVALALIGGGLWWALAGSDDGDGYDQAAYCDAYREADARLSGMDFTTLDGAAFEDLQSTVSEIQDLAPPEVADDWATLEDALNQFEQILNDAGLTFDDLAGLSAGQVPEGVSQAELQQLGEDLTEFSQSKDFEKAGNVVDKDAQERCDIPAGGGS